MDYKERDKKIMMWKSIGLFICFLAAISCRGGTAKEFENGDVVCFLGDSITHSGYYPYYILEYYASRYPDRKLSFHNCGISGDSAAGAWKRLTDDVLSRRPTKTAIMLGMNDVGRDLYKDDKPDEKILKKRDDRIACYKGFMDKIVKELKNKKIEVIYITPSPYDQTVKLDAENYQGVNDALGKCAEFCEIRATKNDDAFVGFHKPMTAINLKNQKIDPKFTLIGLDRIHPLKTGHFVMAYLFLKAQDVSPVVSNVKIDFKTGKVSYAENCEVSNIYTTSDCLTFDCLEKALPLPISNAYQEADKIVPVTKELNIETITINNLPDGNFTLFIDDKKIIEVDSGTWAQGVNIANLPSPQQEQAQNLHHLIMEKHKKENILRNIQKLEIMMKNENVDSDNPQKRDMFFAKLLKRLEDGRYQAYFAKLIQSYKINKLKEKELVGKIRELDSDIYTQKKMTYHYKIKRGSDVLGFTDKLHDCNNKQR